MPETLTLADVMPATNDSLPADAPTVAVIVSLNVPGANDEIAELTKRFTTNALAELNELGARVILLDSSGALEDKGIADAADGVLFLGGGDVESSLYGHDGPVPREWGVDRAADDYCIDIIHSTIDRDAPMLCICRGSQLLNVALGGDLYPDIEDFDIHRGGDGVPVMKDEAVNIVAGSKAREILGRDRVTVRSGHHQAVKTVAPPLRAAAIADDGIVEATELPTARWVLGFQWHPEDNHGSDSDRRAVFGAFVNEIRNARS